MTLAAAFTGETLDESLLNTWIDAINANTNAINALNPGGTVVAFMGSSAPSGWALINGASITSCSTLYPETWANTPTSWHSGTTLVLPDAANKTLFHPGSGFTLGATVGSNSKTIATGNLPSHSHTGTTSNESADHVHSGTTSTESATHAHGVPIPGSSGFVVDGIGPPGPDHGTAGIGAGTGYGLQSLTATESATHTHTVTTGGVNANHTHTFTTSSVGSGTALDVTNAGLVANYIIRLR